MRPLPKDIEPPSTKPQNAHCGLWYDKFCDKWCLDTGKSGENAWNLKSFLEPQKKKKVTRNPKMEWIETLKCPCGNKEQIEELTDRQQQLANSLNGRFGIFKTNGRFVTGLGRSHPIENGFTWHPTLGTPYLPGSSVKGLVRAWIEHWLEDNTDNNPDGQKKPSKGEIDRVFGPKDNRSSNVGSVIFLDALPAKQVQMEADVMTPHYEPYYSDLSGKNDPGDWYDPVPIPFLAVAADQPFQFGVLPGRQVEETDVERVMDWLESALQWIGAGAKTAVGYGRFVRDEEKESEIETARLRAEANLEKERQEAELEEKLSALSPLAQDFEREARKFSWDTDKQAFTQSGVIEGWIDRLAIDLQPDVIHRLYDLVNQHFPGLLSNPDKTKGKKNKPVFKDRQRAFAKRLNELFSKLT